MSKHGKCHLCDATCLQCTGPESEDCISCPEARWQPLTWRHLQCRWNTVGNATLQFLHVVFSSSICIQHSKMIKRKLVLHFSVKIIYIYEIHYSFLIIWVELPISLWSQWISFRVSLWKLSTVKHRDDSFIQWGHYPVPQNGRPGRIVDKNTEPSRAQNMFRVLWISKLG